MSGPDGQENIPHREWLVTFDKVVNDIKEDLKKQGRGDEFVGARVSNAYLELYELTIPRRTVQIIYCTVRFISPEELEWYTEDCLTLKQEFPHIIAGP